MNVTAKANFHGIELDNIPVINPGNWFGKTWLIELGGSYTPLFFIAEADSVCDVIDEIADNEAYSHHIVVDDIDLGDYPEESRQSGPSGQVLDLDHLIVFGDEGKAQPFQCRYFGNGFPSDGIVPSEIWEYDPADCES